MVLSTEYTTEEIAEELSDIQESAATPFQAIAIIGLGVIGASLGAAVKAAFPETFVFGVARHESTYLAALEKGWVDEASAPDDPAFEEFIRTSCDLVVLATPVAAIDHYLNLLADWGYTGLITDAVSTKSHIITSINEILPDPARFIPGHPMAGSEKSGIAGARPDLYKGANWILCPDESTATEDFQRLHEFVTGLEARVVSLPREEHDQAVAIVSHVPHMVASALMQLAEQHTDESRALMRLAAGGFKDSTRIAAGSPELWSGIAFDNADALKAGLSEMRGILERFITALDQDDRASFVALLAEAADARKSLPAAWVPATEDLVEVRIPMVDRTGVVAEVTTIASSVGCNIQSIEIDHITDANAVLSLILTDEGDIGKLSMKLIKAGFSVSFNPLFAKGAQ